MYSSFQRLLRASSKSCIPLLSIAVLNVYKKSIFAIDQEGLSVQKQSPAPYKPSVVQSINSSAWQWDRIIQINSPEELSESDILQKSIIVYQMTGNSEIDSQVALIAHLFCDKYFGKISQKFQFVFMTPNPAMQQMDDEMLFVIFGKQGSKYVPIKKYINSHLHKKKFIPNYNPLFNRMLQEVNKYHELSLQNIHQHLEHLQCEGRDTYQLLIIPQNDSEKEINRSKHILEKFLKNRQIWNSEIIKSVVTDQQTKTILGLNNEEIHPNKVYLIAPKNQNLLHKPANKFKIGTKSYAIIPGQQIQKQFIFPPIPPQLSPQSFILKFNVDLNQTRPEILTNIYDMMRDDKLIAELRINKLLTFSKGDEPIQITIEKNNHDNIIHAYDQACMYEEGYKRDLLHKANVWKYPETVFDTEKLKEFVKAVVNRAHDPENEKKKELYEFYKSQPLTQAARKNSKLIVGEQRQATINSNGDKIIFHFSKNCHSCKRFGGVYEQIAGQTNGVKFFRIDNDTNKTQGLKNYNSTPIFVMYKNGYSNLPWYFKMPYFTKKLFSNFIQITKQIKTMNSAAFKYHIAEHIENEDLVKQTLKQVI